MALDLTRSQYVKKLVLIHQTDLPSAEAIISSQTMLPGSDGCFGGGIYFANTIEAASQKAIRKGVFLVAEVYLGKFYPCPLNEYQSARSGKQTLILNGYQGVVGYQISNGREIVAYNSSQVKNIKYCYGPQRPQAVFRAKVPKLVLFLVTNKNEASQIVNSQNIKKTNGAFGRAVYLFDSITDALQIHQNEETFLACEVKMKDFFKLKKIVDVNSHKVPQNSKTFYGTVNNIQHFVIKDKRLIKNIHFCGGQNWN